MKRKVIIGSVCATSAVVVLVILVVLFSRTSPELPILQFHSTWQRNDGVRFASFSITNPGTSPFSVRLKGFSVWGAEGWTPSQRFQMELSEVRGQAPPRESWAFTVPVPAVNDRWRLHVWVTEQLPLARGYGARLKWLFRDLKPKGVWMRVRVWQSESFGPRIADRAIELTSQEISP